MKYIFKYWLPVLIYAGAIFFLSSMEKPPTPEIEMPNFDKLLHLIEYGIFSFLIGRALYASSRIGVKAHASYTAIIITILYALSDEIHQAFVPMREAAFLDWLFDSFGAVITQIIVIIRQK